MFFAGVFEDDTDSLIVQAVLNACAESAGSKCDGVVHRIFDEFAANRGFLTVFLDNKVAIGRGGVAVRELCTLGDFWSTSDVVVEDGHTHSVAGAECLVEQCVTCAPLQLCTFEDGVCILSLDKRSACNAGRKEQFPKRFYAALVVKSKTGRDTV